MTDLGQQHQPGWYADPMGGPGHRWWDGARWTAQVASPVPPVVDRAGRSNRRAWVGIGIAGAVLAALLGIGAVFGQGDETEIATDSVTSSGRVAAFRQYVSGRDGFTEGGVHAAEDAAKEMCDRLDEGVPLPTLIGIAMGATADSSDAALVMTMEVLGAGLAAFCPQHMDQVDGLPGR